MEQDKFQYHNIARIVIEAKTPLAVGSGDKDLLTDSVVSRDANNLPFIPGSTIAGIIRHAIRELGFDDTYFGYGKSDRKPKSEGQEQGDLYPITGRTRSHGSEIIFTSAQIVDKGGKAIEGLISSKSEYLQKFDELPIRQHVRINEKGTAEKEKHGKFDEQVVFKGTRFCFEIELLSMKKDDSNFTHVLNELAKDTIRIGGGTRKGFGEIEIVECRRLKFDLSDSNDLTKYINKSSSLNDSNWILNASTNPNNQSSDNWTEYKLELTPDDFFLFGSGFGNDEADMTPVTEKFIYWDDKGNPTWKEDTILIPGSSIKGAVSHRVAFHYNKLKKFFVGNENATIGYDNEAVRALFGFAIDNDNIQRGNVMISDVIQSKRDEKSKILNHVSIDRFTGGAIEGALFTESVTYGKDNIYVLVFKVNNNVLKGDIEEVLEKTLFDITNGMLPIGGGVNRGHGCFSGKIYKNSKELKI
ncbi:hypothetical protein AGMMS49574_05370 [Bacteroidia bacterium]|nr:hypothetical protein AGMMS49574_05370 [Bacteroidia bacterium]